MYHIKTLNSISPKGLERLSTNLFAVDAENDAQPDGILLRSASMHEMDLPETLVAIARAGAGTNNVPVDKCAENGIVRSVAWEPAERDFIGRSGLLAEIEHG
ncbi:MAG: hypothetical protein RR825_06150, partial [Ruthenibacterium sp.]